MATDPGTLISSTRPVPERDPARRGRAAFLVVSLLLLWPLLVYTEFRPWEMLDARSLRVTARFLAGFVPPALNADFLASVARETWRTVAIATAGVSLALLLAVPLALIATAALSISSLSGRMAVVPFVVRQAARGAMVALRTVPELVWALAPPASAHGCAGCCDEPGSERPPPDRAPAAAADRAALPHRLGAAGAGGAGGGELLEPGLAVARPVVARFAGRDGTVRRRVL